MESINIETLLKANGAVLCQSMASFTTRLNAVSAFLFDWDGVFNAGEKVGNLGSPFYEADSMGINLLRFSYWKLKGQVPVVALLSGEKSETSLNWAKRESLHACYYKCSNKLTAFQHFLAKNDLNADQVAYFFDDVLDLGVAQAGGLRIFFPRKNNPIFNHFVVENKLADYICSTHGGNFALREATEFLIYANGNFEAVIQERMHHTSSYKSYLVERNSNKPKYYTLVDQHVMEVAEP